MKGLIERAIEVVDIEKITKDVMSTLTITDLELYFVVRPQDRDEMLAYEFVGLAYSEQAAKVIWVENSKASPCKIFRLDLGQALLLARNAGIIKEVT